MVTPSRPPSIDRCTKLSAGLGRSTCRWWGFRPGDPPSSANELITLSLSGFQWRETSTLGKTDTPCRSDEYRRYLVGVFVILDRNEDSAELDRLWKQRTALVLQLRQALAEYYPAALEAFDDWTAESSWNFIQAFPTSQALTKLAVAAGRSSCTPMGSIVPKLTRSV